MQIRGDNLQPQHPYSAYDLVQICRHIFAFLHERNTTIFFRSLPSLASFLSLVSLAPSHFSFPLARMRATRLGTFSIPQVAPCPFQDSICD
jgi:hypothetical protein